MNDYENEFLASFSKKDEYEYESCKCRAGCIRNEITNLKYQVERIEEKLNVILQKLDNSIIKNCDKMGDHIDFVNSVYDTVKVPLHYISNKIHKIVNPLGSGSTLKSNSNAHLAIDMHVIERDDDGNVKTYK